MDRLDATGNRDVSALPQPLVLSPDKTMRDLEEIRIAALAAGAFAPAIRCVELQGRHIGLWSSEIASGPTLEELVGGSFRQTRAEPDR